MKWYYVENGQQAGPIEETEFPQLVRTGKLRGETLVWREGMTNWEPFAQACPTELASTTATVTAGTEAVCVECGGIFDKNEMISHANAYICAKCKPTFMQKLAEGVPIKTGELRYAGFWLRFAAKMVDGIIVSLPLMAVMIFVVLSTAQTNPEIGQLFILLCQLGFYVIYALYNIFFVGRFGATPGKMVCKIKVVTAQGEKVSYGRATGRFFAEVLSGMICYLGYLIAAFDQEKRSLHDHICNTRVVYK